MLNGRIGFISHEGDWELYIWGRNLTDERGPVDSFREFFGTTSCSTDSFAPLVRAANNLELRRVWGITNLPQFDFNLTLGFLAI